MKKAKEPVNCFNCGESPSCSEACNAKGEPEVFVFHCTKCVSMSDSARTKDEALKNWESKQVVLKV